MYVFTYLFFMITPAAYGSSPAKNWIKATAMAVLDPLTHCVGAVDGPCTYAVPQVAAVVFLTPSASVGTPYASSFI